MIQDSSQEVLNSENPVGQTQTVVAKADYENAVAFGTKARQSEIALAKKLAEKDPSSIYGLDSELQNKVVKDLYGFSSIQDLVSIRGETFWEQEVDDEKVDDKYEVLNRKIKELEYRDSVEKLDQAIENLKLSKPELFRSDVNAESSLRAELKNISSSLPIKDRLDRATKIVFGNATVSPYEMASLSNDGGTAQTSPTVEKGRSKNEEELRKFFSIK